MYCNRSMSLLVRCQLPSTFREGFDVLGFDVLGLMSLALMSLVFMSLSLTSLGLASFMF